MIIKVLTGDNVIGVIQSLSLSGGVNSKLSISRMILEKQKILYMFTDNKTIGVNTQLVPIQIVVEDNGQEINRLHNVWFEKVEYTFTTNEWIIAEGVEAMAETVSGNFK